MHPLVKIVFLIWLLLLVNLMSVNWLIGICLLMVVLALLYGNGKFLLSIKRMRWLWLTLILIYAMTTPGEYISVNDIVVKVTYEGLISGLLQMVRLVTAIAGINLLFSTAHKKDLLIGLTALLSPLKLLKLNVERFSTRLFLTLEYVDDIAINSKMNLSFLNALSQPPKFLDHQTLQIPHMPLSWFDKIALCLMVSIDFSLILMKVL